MQDGGGHAPVGKSIVNPEAESLLLLSLQHRHILFYECLEDIASLINVMLDGAVT